MKPAPATIWLPEVTHERGYLAGFPVPRKINTSQISAIDAELHPVGKQT